MIRRSGKMQFLFWAFFFSVLLYLWILWIGVRTFLLHKGPMMELPQQEVTLLFILYGFLIVTTMAGTVVSIMIGNRPYIRRFGAMVILVFATIIAAKGIFG
ncbi:hypothetical protein [Nitratifractor sp.]|uniref:hypothetical protein n=1 Tax=Nitratifractor sp. TaxID=2268144 RepID=UPI0025D32621|nr:hypothetical protein [Nitratifractor sp.]